MQNKMTLLISISVFGLLSCASDSRRIWSAHDADSSSAWTSHLETKFDKEHLLYKFTMKDTSDHIAFHPGAKTKSPLNKPISRLDIFDAIDDPVVEDLVAFKDRISAKGFKNVKIRFYDKQGFKVDELNVPLVENASYKALSAKLSGAQIPMEYICNDSVERKTDIDSDAVSFDVDLKNLQVAGIETDPMRASLEPSTSQ